MDNLLESNERTLVMFESVCHGLAECLALVHNDIRQMTEHRNVLLANQVEQHHQAADVHHLTPADQVETTPTNRDKRIKSRQETSNYAIVSQKPHKALDHNMDDELDKTIHNEPDDSCGDDPHHLARLKLLDKRLADSFSKALSMCDQQKTSLEARQQLYQHNNNKQVSDENSCQSNARPSIFQVLLAKTSLTRIKSGNKLNKHQTNCEQNVKNQPPDDRVIIDDINKQTRMAMQYSKQLEAHLYKVEDLRSKYEMHLKMGLVVKSVSRAYLTCSNNSSSALVGNYSAPSIHHQQSNLSPTSRQNNRQLYTSSLMVNDSSSIGTHSSLSSLNLSTWSFSRSRRRERKDQQQEQERRNRHQQELNSSSPSSKLQQKYVSTASLDSNKRNRTSLNLTKLISTSSAISRRVNQSKQPNNNHQDHRLSQYAFGFDSPPLNTAGERDHDDTLHSTIQHRERLNNRAMDPYYTHVDDYNETLRSTSSANLAKSPSCSSLKRIKSKNQFLRSSVGAPPSKTTIKEFIENIDRIEAEFESYMGSFLLTVEDIQGFARVCQGDVFEINIRYGDIHKFKTKISVLKDNKQKCDNRQSVFKARIADVLAIKAYECKGLGKKVLLGHKLCETRDFFTARSQMMTISLNHTGSIKLNMVITWNPLHLAPNSSLAGPGLDISHISLPPTPLSSSTISSLSSVPSMNGTTTTINIQANNRTPSRLSSHSPSAAVGRGVNASVEDDDLPASFYDVDPTYSYYIPEPDYMTTAPAVRSASTTNYSKF